MLTLIFYNAQPCPTIPGPALYPLQPTHNYLQIQYQTMDLINVLWQDKIKIIGNKYNRVATDFSYRRAIGNDKDVVIYHYTINKPWSAEMKDNPYAYGWCLNKYLEYADFKECRQLKEQIKKNNKGISAARKIKGFVKSRFAINYGKPLLSGRWVDYLIYKI